MPPVRDAARPPMHPWTWICSTARPRVFLVLAVANLALLGVLLGIAPAGLWTLHTAGAAAPVVAVLAGWTVQEHQQAMLFLGLDYLYLVIYPACFSLGSAQIAQRLRATRPGWSRLGIAVAWAVLAGGLVDAVENVAIIRLLTTPPSDGWAQLAAGCGGLKWLLAGLGLGYLLAGYALSRQPSSP